MSRDLATLNPTLRQILEAGAVISKTGEPRSLDSAISTAEGFFIQDIIRLIRPQSSLEVGCAYGISSLFICQALKEVGAERHMIIDPCQFGDHGTGFEGIGLANLASAGFSDFVAFYPHPSYRTLPNLEQTGCRIDFAFIDGMHTFDYALVDFFYIDKMLTVGGVVVFDDISFPSIRKLCRFILRNLPYSALGPEVSGSTGGRRLAEQVASIHRSLGKTMCDDITIPDAKIGLPLGNFIALRKNADDVIGKGAAFDRRWDTHHRF